VGALYHRGGNDRFEDVLAEALANPEVQVVLLPRTAEQRQRYEAAGATIPDRAIDGASLLALADVVVGAGGTMSREAALLGVPTHTVFAGRLAAVDAALIAGGRLRDLRADGDGPAWVKRPADVVGVDASRADLVSAAVEKALRQVAVRPAPAGRRAAEARS
jgi:predicted glycosyltransferase